MINQINLRRKKMINFFKICKGFLKEESSYRQIKFYNHNVDCCVEGFAKFYTGTLPDPDKCIKDKIHSEMCNNG